MPGSNRPPRDCILLAFDDTLSEFSFSCPDSFERILLNADQSNHEPSLQ